MMDRRHNFFFVLCAAFLMIENKQLPPPPPALLHTQTHTHTHSPRGEENDRGGTEKRRKRTWKHFTCLLFLLHLLPSQSWEACIFGSSRFISTKSKFTPPLTSILKTYSFLPSVFSLQPLSSKLHPQDLGLAQSIFFRQKKQSSHQNGYFLASSLPSVGVLNL